MTKAAFDKQSPLLQKRNGKQKHFQFLIGHWRQSPSFSLAYLSRPRRRFRRAVKVCPRSSRAAPLKHVLYYPRWSHDFQQEPRVIPPDVVSCFRWRTRCTASPLSMHSPCIIDSNSSTVVAVNYDLAPQAQFPAQVRLNRCVVTPSFISSRNPQLHQCLHAYAWVRQNASSFGWSGQK
jgi:hypothetical protein